MSNTILSNTNFQLLGYPAIFKKIQNEIEVFVPSEEEATQVVLRVANTILDGKLQALRVNFPDHKTFYITAHDNSHLKFRRDENKELN